MKTYITIDSTGLCINANVTGDNEPIVVPEGCTYLVLTEEQVAVNEPWIDWRYENGQWIAPPEPEPEPEPEQ